MSKIKVFLLIGLVVAMAACKSKPTIILEEPATTESEKPAQSGQTPMDLHEIKVQDLQHTTKYTYLHVLEGSKSYCVAIPLSKDVKKDQTYYFRGGILMANPEILNFKEKFETVMIAPGLTENPLGTATAEGTGTVAPAGKDGELKIKDIKIVPAPGVLKLADLFKDPQKYDGKTIKVQGQCVKLNRMILNKNWLHIQDHTKNKQDQNYDLTITTLDEVQLGDVVIFEGKLTLNKDFGAGYKYDVILEEAKLR